MKSSFHRHAKHRIRREPGQYALHAAEHLEDRCLLTTTFAAGVGVGTVTDSNIVEASGLAASRTSAGVLWTHNDKGDAARIFALSTDGRVLGAYNFSGVSNTDFEDIAIGPGPASGVQYLYVGDIGDKQETRTKITVYRVPEPSVYDNLVSNPDRTLTGVQSINFTYPDGAHNAEALMIDPRTGDLFIATKVFGSTAIYRASAAQMANASSVVLSYVTTIALNASQEVTAGDISATGQDIILKGYNFALLWKRAAGQSVGDALAGPSQVIPLANEPHGEALGFDSIGNGYYTLSEGTNQTLYHYARTSDDAPTMPQVLLPLGSQWQFLDNGSNQGTAWRAAGFDSSSWTTGTGQFGYGDGDERTTINYGPNANAKYVTTYFRTTFVADPLLVDQLTVQLLVDDGAAVYLNGTQIVRTNLASGAAYNTLASSAQTALSDTFVSFSVDAGLLLPGVNTLAVEVHQDKLNTADMSFDLQLLSVTPTDVQTSLRITEIMYHPADPPVGSPFVNGDFEYIELQNIGQTPLAIGGARFKSGVDFVFPDQTLAPGQYVLVVSNLVAFQSRYGASLNVAGQFSGSLNNAGEEVRLDGSLAEPILDFSYSPAWYPLTDTQGRSLTVVNAAAMVNAWDTQAQWRASTAVGGSPGLSDAASSVVGRRVFYNNSEFDGNSATSGVADDGAIATDKAALLPGGAATFANYTSYSRGINGIMIDVSQLAGAPTSSDFVFRVGNDSSPAGWTLAPVPTSINVRPGAGAGGSDRVTITWADGAIKNQWLQVTMLPTAATGLAVSDVFYFGNAVGESGNSTTDAAVNAADELATRNNPRTFDNRAPISFAFDFNRDGFVNATDQLLARVNSTTLATRLQLITPPAALLLTGAPASLTASLAAQSTVDRRIAPVALFAGPLALHQIAQAKSTSAATTVPLMTAAQVVHARRAAIHVAHDAAMAALGDDFAMVFGRLR